MDPCCLLLRDERGELHRIALDTDRIRIGREPECEVHVDDRSVSRHHARIARRDGRLVLQDEGSRTGTLLNGARITMATVLASGDWMRVGHCLALVLDHEPGEADEHALAQLADQAGLTGTDLDVTRVLFSVPVVREAARETATAPQLALLEHVSDALRDADGIDHGLRAHGFGQGFASAGQRRCQCVHAG